MATEYLETALRVWAEPLKTNSVHGRARPAPRSLPKYVLVLDTETTVDAAQRLLFGSYRYFRASWDGGDPRMTCAEEGLFYADDLPSVDPLAFVVLSRYVQEHDADVAPRFRRVLRLTSESEFLKKFYKEAYKKRSLIVGFNLPFDLSRFARAWGEARRRPFLGGHSLALWGFERDGVWEPSHYRPRISIKTIDSKRAFKGFSGRESPDDEDLVPEGAEGSPPDPTYIFRGHFLDLRTLAFALTDKSHSLASACVAFGVEHGKVSIERHGEVTEHYIDYNRRDVLATSELLVELMREYLRHPIDLQVTKAYSPASIGKAYLRSFGVTPILERQPDFPREVLGYAMSAFFGGRSECRIRKTRVPVVYVDFLSMYPTVNALMGLWRLQTAEHIHVDDVTEKVRRTISETPLDEWFDPAQWRTLAVFVQVRSHGEILPVRGRYDETRDGWQIGVNPLWSEPRWYALADVVAATLLTGRVPEVLRAIELRPVGLLPELKPVSLRGGVEVDPATDDVFRVLIEERQRLEDDLSVSVVERDRMRRFLKILANSTAYGISAELNRRPESGDVRVFTESADFETRLSTLEVPGAFCFPPIAALIAAAARLMLALLERSVADLGGTYAFCDTDSMGVVATEAGGSVHSGIRALSWKQVEGISERFASLNPYDRSAVPGSVLKIEQENFGPDSERIQLWAFAISAKRYALFEE